MLPALALLLCALPVGQQAPDAAAPVADVRKELPLRPPAESMLRIHRGGVWLVRGESIERLTRVDGSRRVEGAAYIELGAGGEIELAWPGLASLRVTGPAALEWTPSASAPNEGAVQLYRFRRLEAEVRRGRRDLRLPQGWNLSLARGAVHAEERVTGDVLVHHRGGADAHLTSRAQREAKLPDKVRSGQRLLLPRLPDERERPTR
ncbi:MAG: hypothetical protein AAF682_21355 [Planctomycetota bacterium]